MLIQCSGEWMMKYAGAYRTYSTSASTIFSGYKLHFRLGMVDSGLDVSQCWQLPPTWHQPHPPSAILNKEEWGDAHLDELLEARKNSKPSSAESIWKQKMWDRPLIES